MFVSVTEGTWGMNDYHKRRCFPLLFWGRCCAALTCYGLASDGDCV